MPRSCRAVRGFPTWPGRGSTCRRAGNKACGTWNRDPGRTPARNAAARRGVQSGAPRFAAGAYRALPRNRFGSLPWSDSAGSTLTIPRGIRYSGRIGRCERITVGGTVETELDGCRVLAAGGAGVFRGAADVETADICGTLEGPLRVRRILTVRASARIFSGALSYPEIEIERGGGIASAVRPCPADADQVDPVDKAQPAADAL